MRSRLFRASISTLFTGEHGIISVKQKPAFFTCSGHSYRSISNPRTLANCQFHSSSNEDDDFAELGSPVSQGVVSTVPKLMTEKRDSREPLRHKTDPARKDSSSTSLPAKSITNLKDIPLKQGKPLPALHLILENGNEVSRLNVNSKNASNCKNSSSITIENIPSITRSFHHPIRPLHIPETVTVRISNISTKTADSEIHSMCMSYSPLDGLERTKDDAVDALFSVKDKSETLSILQKLNRTIIDDCRWSAHVLPRDSTSKVKTNNEDARCKLRTQINSRLADLISQSYMKKLYLEDFETLHHALVHLEGHPANISK